MIPFWQRVLILIGFLVASLCIAHAQPKVSGRISGGFQAPTSTDDQGRRHVLKGSTAEPRGPSLYELTDPRVTSFNAEDAAEMFIEAPRCFYNMKENVAFSDASLSVRTADGRFSIQGVGWGWDPASANLTISNKVVAYVQKSALATNVASRATNAPVRITADSFQQRGETASFVGDVIVEDGADRLTCEQLNLKFVKPGGVQTIEAVRNMNLSQGETKVASGRAIYDLKENTIRITEDPRWSSELREGSADTLLVDRNERTLIAEGKVYMKLPLTNVAAVASSEVRAQTNRFLEIHAGKFRFEEATSNRVASALYESDVRVIHTDATISCSSLTVGFDATNRVQKIRAEGQVKIQSEESQAFGDVAEYDMQSEKIVLSGNPRWNVEESRGQSDVLIFYPKTREIMALQNVEMTLPGQSIGSMFAVNVRTNQTAGTNTPIVIRSYSFSRGTNVAVFHKNVVITDARGRMSCDMVTIVTTGTNQVQRIIAENQVRIEQQDFTATGSRAEYNVATGLVHLTGEPQLISEDKSLRAEAFIIDRNRNTFSVAPGKYRIQMQMKKSNSARPLTSRP